MSSTTSPMQPVHIACQDGTRLTGHFFAAQHVKGMASTAPVLLCPATGVRQHFYFNFAHWLASQGHEVLVFDYRGIGLSLTGPLKHNRATLSEWGQQDQVAALNWLVRETGKSKVLLLGHSAGGQMIGLLPNHQYVARVVGVASSTGWFKQMRLGFRLKAMFGLRVFLPLGIWFKGYAPCKAIGLGENLPATVAKQWAQWCSHGGYATQAVKHTPQLDYHAHVNMPFTVFHASDDDIATEGTVANLLSTLPAAQKKAYLIEPRAHGLSGIGHMDWFRSSHQVLWPMLANALTGSKQE